jgi:hypothetical protein
MNHIGVNMKLGFRILIATKRFDVDFGVMSIDWHSQCISVMNEDHVVTFLMTFP